MILGMGGWASSLPGAAFGRLARQALLWVWIPVDWGFQEKGEKGRNAGEGGVGSPTIETSFRVQCWCNIDVDGGDGDGDGAGWRLTVDGWRLTVDGWWLMIDDDDDDDDDDDATHHVSLGMDNLVQLFLVWSHMSIPALLEGHSGYRVGWVKFLLCTVRKWMVYPQTEEIRGGKSYWKTIYNGEVFIARLADFGIHPSWPPPHIFRQWKRGRDDNHVTLVQCHCVHDHHGWAQWGKPRKGTPGWRWFSFANLKLSQGSAR